MSPLIGQLCMLPEGGVDWRLMRALQETLSLDDAYDIAEINEVSRSHRDALEANMKRAHKKRKDT